MTENKKVGRMPSFTEAFLVFVLVVGVILYGIVGLRLGPHMPMFIALVITVLLGFYLKYPWSEIEDAMFKGIHVGIVPILIMLLIGMIIGSWIAAGVIPYIIYIGIKLFSPQWFLVSALLACSVLSLSTGSSWTTLGTLGVAFMGIGQALGIPPAMTAGAVISGSVFGDKQSPLSETTTFAAAVAETKLFDHIRSMLYSTLPAFIIASIIYVVMGFRFAGATVDVENINTISSALLNAFNFNPVLLVLPAFLIVIVVKKIPALIGLSISALLGFIFAIVFQGVGLTDIMNYMHYGYVADTGIDAVNSILSKGGLNSMMWTISLMFLALPMGGVLERTGVLAALLLKMSNIVNSVIGLITSTLASVLALAFVTADTYLPMLIGAKTYGPAFDKLSIDRKVLSRSLEDTGTLGSWMVPWSESGMFAAATIGMSAFTYLPYYFLGTVTPIVSIILAATGIGIFRTYKSKAESNSDGIGKTL